MLDWLNPTFDDAEIIESWSFDPSHLLYLLSISLSDCLEPEVKLLAQRVLTSLKQLEKKIKTERKRKVELLPQDLSSLNTSFQSDLNLNFLDEDRILSWSLSQVDEPKWSLLTYVAFRLPVHLQEKFEKIQIFMWGMYDLAGMISSLDRLPPISTLIVQPGSYVDVEVNFDLNYEIAITTTATSLATQLRHFTFGFKKDCIPSWKGLFSGQLDTDDLIIGETRKTGEKAEINWLTVRVRRSLDQSQLVRILVELALEIAVIPLETKRNEKNCSLM